MRTTTFLLALGVVLQTTQAQTTAILYSIKDAPFAFHDGNNTANTNYNSHTHFSGFSQTTNDGTNTGRSVIEFDLSSIPPDSTILAAFLGLTARGPFGLGPVGTQGHVGPGNDCVLRRVITPWQDNTITWNNQPQTTTQNEVLLAPSSHTMENYLNINVTELVRDMVADAANSHGFMLSLVNETPPRSLAFHTGLAPEMDRRPVLLVVYGDCNVVTGMQEEEGSSRKLVVSPSLTSPGNTILVDAPMALKGRSVLTLTDASGRLVATMPVSSWPYSMIVPAVGAGAYTVSVQQNGSSDLMTARIVVQ
jgi:hypothetical protein